MIKSLLSVEVSFLDGFCDTVQGLLDWFEVDSPSFCLSRLICALSAQISFSCWNDFCLLKSLLSVEVSFSIEVSFVCWSLFFYWSLFCLLQSLLSVTLPLFYRVSIYSSLCFRQKTPVLRASQAHSCKGRRLFAHKHVLKHNMHDTNPCWLKYTESRHLTLSNWIVVWGGYDY